MKRDDPIGLIILRESIKNKSIIEDSWKGFAVKVIPDIKSNQTQYIEMRKAYYCGFYSNFDLMNLISCNYSEKAAMTILDNIKEQCEKEIKKFANWESIN